MIDEEIKLSIPKDIAVNASVAWVGICSDHNPNCKRVLWPLIDLIQTALKDSPSSSKAEG